MTVTQEKISQEFYKTHLKQFPSDLERFGRAVQVYGSAIVHDAIVITAIKGLETDPLGYVLSVAHAKWREQLQEEEQRVRYEMRIEIAKERTRENSEQLAWKINKARERRANDSDNSDG